MIYKGTNKEAYTKAKSYPKLFRSSAYKVHKFLDSKSDKQNEHSQNYKVRINHRHLSSNRKKATSYSSKFLIIKRSGIYNVRLQLNNEVNPNNKRIIRKFSRNIVDSFVDYASKKILSWISKSFHIVIDVGMIAFYCSQINAEKDKYELIAEVIEGDAKLKDNYIELLPFFQKHVELFNHILSLCNNLI